MRSAIEPTPYDSDQLEPQPRKSWRRFFLRGPWENAACWMIGLGVFMLMQPFAVEIFSYSFVVILVGTLGFVVVSHFPER